MRLIKQEDFAILLMSELAKNYGRKSLSLSHVAEAHGVSVLFLKKIARFLRLSGLVISKEGVTGGYVLAREPRSITVWDILLAVSGKPATAQLSQNPCPLYTRCLPQKIHQYIENSLEKSLREISLQLLAS